MKNLFLFICLFFIGINANSQWNYYSSGDCDVIGDYCFITDNGTNYYTVYSFHDTSFFVIYSDTLDLSNFQYFMLSGNSNQYVRGDGSITSFPTIPTNTNQLTNGAGFLTSEIDGSVTNEIELPSQTGNGGRTLKTNGSTVSWGKRQETYSGTTSGSGTYTVTFGITYSVAPNIQANIIGGTANQFLVITSISTTGFTVTSYQRNSVTILGIEVLLAATPTFNGANIDVLITEK